MFNFFLFLLSLPLFFSFLFVVLAWSIAIVNTTLSHLPHRKECSAVNTDVLVEVADVLIPLLRFLTLLTASQLLNERDTIKAFAGNGSLVVSSCIQEGLADGTIVEAVMMDEACGTVINNTALEEAGVEARAEFFSMLPLVDRCIGPCVCFFLCMRTTSAPCEQKQSKDVLPCCRACVAHQRLQTCPRISSSSPPNSLILLSCESLIGNILGRPVCLPLLLERQRAALPRRGCVFIR